MVSLVKNMKILLLDIEGTVTSISFVKEVLFSYARRHVAEYVQENWGKSPLTEDMELLIKQCQEDIKLGEEGVPVIPDPSGDALMAQKKLVEYVLWQMDRDKKTTSLKQLQGHLWQTGYHRGEIKGHIYNDVFPVIKKWCSLGRKIYIYSSGSVEAQKLLFSQTDFGDITKYLSGYFDTKVGPKREASSYQKIASQIGEEPEQITFLTDIPAEARAAKLAGINSIIVIREGNALLTDQEKKEFPQIHSLDELLIE